MVLLLLAVFVLVGVVLALVLKRKPVRMAAAIAGLVTGLFTGFVAFALIGADSGYSDIAYGFSASASVGAGTVILAFASVGLLAASVVALLPVGRKPGVAASAGSAPPFAGPTPPSTGPGRTHHRP